MTTESVSVFPNTSDENTVSLRASHWLAGAAAGSALFSAGWAVERALNSDVGPTVALSAFAIGVGSLALQVLARAEAPNHFREIFPDLSFKFPTE